MNAATSPNRLIYQTGPLKNAIRISGSPKVSLNMSFSKRGNLTAALVSFPEGAGNGTIVTRGWMDPENRNSEYVSEPTTPGTFYRMNFDVPGQGHRDRRRSPARADGVLERPRVHDPSGSGHPARARSVELDDDAPRRRRLGRAGAGDQRGHHAGSGSGHGNVPATLSLTLGTPASFGAFTPGVMRDYTATTTGTVVSSAGNAALSVSDPSSNNTGKLVNGTFSLPQTLQVRARTGAFAPVGGSAAPTTVLTYTAPISNDAVPIEFKQSIGANDALRTGTYSKTLTFTLSTTQP